MLIVLRIVAVLMFVAPRAAEAHGDIAFYPILGDWVIFCVVAIALRWRWLTARVLGFFLAALLVNLPKWILLPPTVVPDWPLVVLLSIWLAPTVVVAVLWFRRERRRQERMSLRER